MISTLRQLVMIALLGLAFSAAVAVAPARAATCPAVCATAASVLHAAGVPPKLKAAAARLRFDGNGMAASDAAAVQAMAAAFKGLPPKAVVALKVAADSVLQGSAARQQVAARQRALRQALQAAGVSGSRFKLGRL